MRATENYNLQPAIDTEQESLLLFYKEILYRFPGRLFARLFRGSFLQFGSLLGRRRGLFLHLGNRKFVIHLPVTVSVLCTVDDRYLPEIYRDYPRTPSLWCCARNILTVHRETLTQYITFKRGGTGESVLLYSVVLQQWRSTSTPEVRTFVLIFSISLGIYTAQHSGIVCFYKFTFTFSEKQITEEKYNVRSLH
jgi:hypothetical protein